MLWWMSTTIEDNRVNYHGVNSRVIAPFTECGSIFTELFELAIDLKSMSYTQLIFKDKDMLSTDIELPQKDELSNFNDLRYTIKSYRYILSVFLTTGVISKLESVEDYIRFDLIRNDINNRADNLEYFLLNNSNIRKNASSYYDGRLELDLYKLIQEMYLLACSGNRRCSWMLNFNTPLQIWFIITIQNICRLWHTESPTSDRAYYQQTIKYIKNIDTNCLKTLEISQTISTFCLSHALKYSISQLIKDGTSPVATYYTKYLESIKKQARAIDKSGKYRRV